MPQQTNISPPLFTLSIEEFMALQKELVNKEFAKLTSITDSKINKSSYFNFEEAAAFLKVSKPTFSKLRKEGMIHGYKVSENRVLFSETDLIQYLSDRKEH